MTILKNIKTKVKVITKDNYEVGNIFEKYVSEMFPPGFFKIIETTFEIDELYGKGTIDSNNPDLHILDKKTNDSFWVECRYFDKIPKNEILKWSSENNLKKFQKITLNTKEKVYVMIGLEGKPKDPEKLYCIDLEKTPYHTLEKEQYIKNEIYLDYFTSLEHFNKQIPRN